MIEKTDGLVPSVCVSRVVMIRRLLVDLAGGADPSGMDLVRLMRAVNNLIEAAIDERLSHAELSGPRWALLFRLYAEEQCGNIAGVLPTALSRFQQVSKNTISALLRGLEEQGLVERTLDRDDRRAFRIRLSDAGRNLLQQTAPAHVAFANTLTESLSEEERAGLRDLLEKLRSALAERVASGPGREPVRTETSL